MDAETLRREVAGLEWFHTIPLPHGVTTAGHFDTPAQLEQVPFPPDLSGMRCLDVGTADGFWAFEMERRGAAETVAIDIRGPRDLDWSVASRPSAATLEADERSWGKPLALARRALASRIRLETCSAYDVSPERLGTFDFVHVGNLLTVLRDPVRALEALATVCRGRLLSCEVVALGLVPFRRRPSATIDALSGPVWWAPNPAGLRRYHEAAGLVVREQGGVFFVPLGDGHPALDAPSGPAPRQRLHRALTARRGVPHCWLISAPEDPVG